MSMRNCSHGDFNNGVLAYKMISGVAETLFYILFEDIISILSDQNFTMNAIGMVLK